MLSHIVLYFIWYFTLFNNVCSSEIRKSLNIEPLLLRIEKSQLRWFGHVSRMLQDRLPKQALLAKANGRRPGGRPRPRSITLSILDGIAWVFIQAKWWMWSKTVKCGGFISSCCPGNPHKKVLYEKRRKGRTFFRLNLHAESARSCFCISNSKLLVFGPPDSLLLFLMV